MLSTANVCRQPGAGAHLAFCGIYLRALQQHSHIGQKSLHNWILQIIHQTCKIKAKKEVNLTRLAFSPPFFPFSRHRISTRFSSFMLINLTFKNTMSVRVYFLSPPLLKLKPVAKWKEVVIINSLPHTQKNQSSPLDTDREREEVCMCVCLCV